VRGEITDLLSLDTDMLSDAVQLINRIQ